MTDSPSKSETTPEAKRRHQQAQARLAIKRDALSRAHAALRDAERDVEDAAVEAARAWAAVRMEALDDA